MAILILSGCADSMTMPDTGVDQPTTQTKIQPLEGNNFGGHAPIAGAEIFVLQASTSGYSGPSTNLCVGPCSVDANGYGKYAAKTAADGSFNISGDYVCTSGYPVYLVALGGYQTPNQGGPGYSTSPLVITGASVTSTYDFSTFTADNTITFTANNLLYPGQSVTIAGLVNSSGGFNYGWPSANGTWTVTAATTTSFTITGVITTVFPITGNFVKTPPPTATVNDSVTTNNPAIVNMAVLGNCPSGTQKNFGSGSADPIRYVYMNEVSTAAAAFALSAFGSDAFHVGIPSVNPQALINVENAANNAGQLYDIQGSNISGTFDGEGHIANQYTPGSYHAGVFDNDNYGIVDQAKLDTIGNILASCVDSPNTFGKGNTTGTLSANCRTLFQNATISGVKGALTDTPGQGNIPGDIAAAAFNIAHHPSGPGTGAFADTLLALQGTVYPFYPGTGTVDDFTIGIAYSANGIDSPQGIAIDAVGNAFITNYYTGAGNIGNLVGLSPLGVPLAHSPFAVPGARTAAIDNSGNVWATGQNGNFYLLPVTTPGVYSGTVTPHTFAGTSSFGIAIDPTGNLDVTNYLGTAIYQYNTSGTLLHTYAGCGKSAMYVTLANGGNIWTDSAVTNGYICENNATGTNLKQSANYTVGSNNDGPNPFAIDAAGNAWVPVPESGAEGGTINPAVGTTGGALIRMTTAGVATPFITGDIDGPSAVAVDGSGFVWVANKTSTNGGNPTVSEFDATGAAITAKGTGGHAYRYQDTVQGGAFNEANIAIDGSGDVWLAYNALGSGSSTTAIELIGAAAPVVTPLATATNTGKIGVKP